jgi:thiol-disulfide isomerase/thioredoxin
MFMKKLAWAAVAVVLLSTSLSAQDAGTMMKSDKPAPADGSMMKSDQSMSAKPMMVSDADRRMSADPMDISMYNLKGLGKQVVAFTSEMAAQNLAKTQDVVYYFAATWCPDCQATYKDLKANFAMIPMNVTVVFVNYDKAGDLKMKYGITQQHTFVVIGPKGEKKSVWTGPTMVSDLVKKAMAKM